MYLYMYMCIYICMMWLGGQYYSISSWLIFFLNWIKWLFSFLSLGLLSGSISTPELYVCVYVYVSIQLMYTCMYMYCVYACCVCVCIFRYIYVYISCVHVCMYMYMSMYVIMYSYFSVKLISNLRLRVAIHLA